MRGYCHSRRPLSTSPVANEEQSTTDVTTASKTEDRITVVNARGERVTLERAAAAPVYAKPRGETRLGTVKGSQGQRVVRIDRSCDRRVAISSSTLEGAHGELLADYVTFEVAIAKCALPYTKYEGLTSEERDVYMRHMRSVEERKLNYKWVL